MTRAMKMIHFPVTRLTELVSRNGGIMRDNAVEEAKKNIESLRDLALEAIEGALAAIEQTIYASRRKHLSPAETKDILAQADHIVTMCATFELGTLESAAKSLCDVADGLLTRGTNEAAPIIVHVQTMRLLAPGSAPLDAEQTQFLLAELARVAAHFQFAPLSPTTKTATGPEIAD
jgi:hypothetical protein